MPHQRLSTSLSIALVLAVSTALVEAQVRRQPSQGQEKEPVNVSLKVGSGPYASNAPGTCTHAPRAAIYGVPSEMWSVRQQEEGRSVQLTMWRSQKDGEETFTLSVNDKKSLQVSTTRGGQTSGSGTIKLQPSGKGGTFTIEAKTKTGETVTGTIACPSFKPATAEGG